MNSFKTRKCVYSISLLIAFVTPLLLFGQNYQLEGFVIDNNEPLSFVSITLKNTSIGTISNAEGKFRLVVPQQYLNNAISFSLLGYKTKEVKIEAWEKAISLEKVDFLLSEISIMPDDSMLRLMQKAVERIPENYLQTSTRQFGFYRTMLLADTSYQYFGEAILDVYRPPYKSKETGSVKILKSRINRTKKENDMSELYFYGGIYLPFLADFVQQREAFLNPGSFKQYIYSIDEILEQDGMTILKVAFTPKFTSKGLYKGYFHLDKDALTFLDFNFTYTEDKKDKRSNSIHSNLQCISGSYRLNYAKNENHYFLKYILYTEEFKDLKSGKNYTKTNEYVTTEINQDNTSPIPLQEQDLLSTVFSVRATSVNESKWNDYTMLTKEPLQLAFSENQSKQILDRDQTKIHLFSNKEKLIRIASRMQSTIYLSLIPTDYSEGEASFLFSPTDQHTFQIDQPIYQVENQKNLSMSLGYRLSNRFNIFGAQETSLNKNKLEAVSLGILYNIGMKSYGKKLLLSPELSIESTNYGIYLGEFNNSESFRAGGKKINSEKIKLYVGERAFCIQPGLTLNRDLSRNIKLLVGAGYSIKLSSKDLLYVDESSGFSAFRRKTNVPLNEPGITYSIRQSGSWADTYNLSSFNLKIGIILGK
jgi:hypothetical protein